MASTCSLSGGDFIYQPLDTTCLSIRLLKFQAEPDGKVSLHLKQDVRLEDYSKLSKGQETDPAPYTALSYTWGPSSPSRQIEVDGMMVTVRQNLYDFLSTCRPVSYFHFWIDQICIDQKSVNERNHQVTMMGEIYKKALEVRIWLGAGNASSNLAMRYFRTSNSKTPYDLSDFLISQSGQESHTTGPIYVKPGLEMADKMNENIETLLQDGGYRLKPALISAFKNLMSRPYWRRLWILQEVIIARDITVTCGKRSVGWYQFSQPISVNQRWHPLYIAMDHHHVGRKIILAQQRREADFHHLMIDFCGNECQDPRDKIYGLRGLFRLWQRDCILVDYAKSIEEVYIDGVILILKEWSIRKQSWLDIFPYRKAYKALGSNMRPQAEDKVLERLQRDMGILSWDDRDREALKLWYLDLVKSEASNLDNSTSLSE
jgi:hypothetical protein